MVRRAISAILEDLSQNYTPSPFDKYLPSAPPSDSRSTSANAPVDRWPVYAASRLMAASSRAAWWSPHSHRRHRLNCRPPDLRRCCWTWRRRPPVHPASSPYRLRCFRTNPWDRRWTATRLSPRL